MTHYRSDDRRGYYPIHFDVTEIACRIRDRAAICSVPRKLCRSDQPPFGGREVIFVNRRFADKFPILDKP